MSIHVNKNLGRAFFTLKKFSHLNLSHFNYHIALHRIKFLSFTHINDFDYFKDLLFLLFLFVNVVSKVSQRKILFNFIALNLFKRKIMFINFGMTVPFLNRFNCDQHFFFCFEHFWILLIIRFIYNLTFFSIRPSFFFSYNTHFWSHTTLTSFFISYNPTSHLINLFFISINFSLFKIF